jgi:hypothetical protein
LEDAVVVGIGKIRYPLYLVGAEVEVVYAEVITIEPDMVSVITDDVVKAERLWWILHLVEKAHGLGSIVIFEYLSFAAK